MKTDTSERGLERLICTALSGQPCDPPKEGSVAEPRVGYGGVGWSCSNPHDYDREYCVDLVQLAAFLRATQPEAAESLALTHSYVHYFPAYELVMDDLRDYRFFEQDLIHQALEESGGVVQRAADMLGVRRTTLAEKIKRYSIEH